MGYYGYQDCKKSWLTLHSYGNLPKLRYHHKSNKFLEFLTFLLIQLQKAAALIIFNYHEAFVVKQNSEAIGRESLFSVPGNKYEQTWLTVIANAVHKHLNSVAKPGHKRCLGTARVCFCFCFFRSGGDATLVHFCILEIL